jgi:hypothetical protein
MSEYIYNSKISEVDVGSYQERFMEYSNNWKDENDLEEKRVKIITAPSDNDKFNFEDKINSYIEENADKIKIVDIKYQRNSVLIIYTRN